MTSWIPIRATLETVYLFSTWRFRVLTVAHSSATFWGLSPGNKEHTRASCFLITPGTSLKLSTCPDDWNSLLADQPVLTPASLQCILHVAARVNFSKHKSDHVNRLIETLQCYPRNARISRSMKHHVNRLKDKNCLTNSADAQKALNKMQMFSWQKLLAN